MIIRKCASLITLIGLMLSLNSQAAVTVYCCDADAEARFIQDLASLNGGTLSMTGESFESDAWSATRGVFPALNVSSQGITWAANPNVTSGLLTDGFGGAHDGTYRLFAALEAGNATHPVPDAVSLNSGSITLYGVGGWFYSGGGAQLGFTTNGDTIDFTGTQASVLDWTFLGFIDDGGFTTLVIETVDEVGAEPSIFFSDDFILGAAAGGFTGQKLQFSTFDYAVSETAGSAVVTVARSGGTSGSVTIDYATTTEGTATAGQDFTATSGTLTFAEGETEKTITIPIIDDAVYEGDETIILQLSGDAVGVLNTATVTISENDPQPVGSVGFSGAQYRVVENAGSLSITVQRNDGDLGTGSVDYTTSDTTAVAGSDYTATSGTLTFSNGQVSASFSVPITDDAVAEGLETFMVTLSNPVSVGLGSVDYAEVSILDNEPVPSGGSFQFSGDAYSAGESSGQISVPVTRINGSTGTVTLVCATADSSAAAGSDYTATQTTLTFAEGETLKTCNIPILNDSAYENSESFMVGLSSLSGNGVLGTPILAEVTVTDDDPVPAAGSLQFSVSEFSQSEAGGSAVVSVTRSGGTSGAVSVNYATTDVTAVAGEDYTAASGTLSLASGVASASFSVTLLDDNAYEGDETLSLSLSQPAGGAVLGANTQATLLIEDDDQAPTSGILGFSLGEFSAEEFDGSVIITVSREGGSSGSAVVNYATSDDTATAGSDYEVATGTLVFADGELTQDFQVTLNDDAVYEGSETFRVTLSHAFGAVLGDNASVLVRLGDDDDPPAAGALDLGQASYTAAENGGSLTVSINRSGGSTGAISVDYATRDGDAIAESDYTFATGRISFADGETTSKTFQIAILDDASLEGDEQFQVALSNPQGGAVLGSLDEGSVTITDDEVDNAVARIGFAITAQSVSESDGVLDVTILRSDNTNGDTSVDLSVASGTAVADTDFSITPGTLTFTDGVASQTVQVQIIDNTLQDGDKSFTLSLSNVTGGGTLDSAASTMQITIVDDDSATTPPTDGGGSSGGGGGGGSFDPWLLVTLLLLFLTTVSRGYRHHSSCIGRSQDI
ncbi:MAG: Calx-beta domain-containing protein [Candidatus Thiodiazotropha sp.]